MSVFSLTVCGSIAYFFVTQSGPVAERLGKNLLNFLRFGLLSSAHCHYGLPAGTHKRRCLGLPHAALLACWCRQLQGGRQTIKRGRHPPGPFFSFISLSRASFFLFLFSQLQAAASPPDQMASTTFSSAGGGGAGTGLTSDKYFEELRGVLEKDCALHGKKNECHQLGEFYQSVDKNFPAAVKVYEGLCNDRDYAPSCLNLGLLALKGKGACARRVTQRKPQTSPLRFSLLLFNSLLDLHSRGPGRRRGARALQQGVRAGQWRRVQQRRHDLPVWRAREAAAAWGTTSTNFSWSGSWSGSCRTEPPKGRRDVREGLPARVQERLLHALRHVPARCVGVEKGENESDCLIPSPSTLSLSLSHTLSHTLSGRDGFEKDMVKSFANAAKSCEMGHLWGCVNAARMASIGELSLRPRTLTLTLPPFSLTRSPLSTHTKATECRRMLSLRQSTRRRQHISLDRRTRRRSEAAGARMERFSRSLHRTLSSV